MVGHSRATGGAKPSNPNIFTWSNGVAEGRWNQAALGSSPFNEKPGKPNNIAWHYADRLQHEYGGKVYLIGRPINGSTLLSWLDPDRENLGAFLEEVDAALSKAPWGKDDRVIADSFLWSQGESDDVEATMIKTPKHDSLLTYKAGFANLIECLDSQPWFSRSETHFIATELVDNGWLSARNDFYRNQAHWPSGLNMHVAPSAGLNDIGDGAHYDGKSLAEIGKRMFDLRRSLAIHASKSEQ